MVHTTSEKDIRQKSISLESDWSSLYVAGEWVNSGNKRIIKDLNPYIGEVIAEVPSATAEDVDHAFDAAMTAQHENMGRPPQDLAQTIFEGINVIRANRKALAELIVAESGSTITKALFELDISVPKMWEAMSFPFRAFGETMTSVIPS